ncbi:MAG: NAD(P)H-hydrate epimerase [Pirellulales bacterium]
MTSPPKGNAAGLGPMLTRAQARELDRRAIEDCGVNSLVLMENAGRGAVDVLCSLGIGGPVVVCCGKGNNAGDGFVVARHLDVRGYAVRVLAWSTMAELSVDAATNARILEKIGIAIAWLGGERPCANDAASGAGKFADAVRGAAWIVDALLGTGATGTPRPPLDDAIRQINASGTPIFALDVPSGLDCDTGQAGEPTIRAAHTCTFAAAKPGLIAAAIEYVGRLHVADIGVKPSLARG